MTTTAAIALHEIPHELGDFAILVRSGLNKDRAIAIQCFTSSFMSARLPSCAPVTGRRMLGAVAGVVLEGVSGESTWLLAFTAGCFVYIALVSLAPDLLQPHATFSAAADLLAMLLGIALVLVLD